MKKAIYTNNIQSFTTQLSNQKINKYNLINAIIIVEPDHDPKNTDLQKSMIERKENFLYDIDARKSMIDIVSEYLDTDAYDTVKSIIDPKFTKDSDSIIVFQTDNKDEFNQDNINLIFGIADKLTNMALDEYERTKWMNQLELRLYVLDLDNSKQISEVFTNTIKLFGNYKPVLNLFSNFFLRSVSFVSEEILNKLMFSIMYTIMNSKGQRFLLSDYLLFQRILSTISPTEELLYSIALLCFQHTDETHHKSHWYFYLLIKQILEHPKKPNTLHNEIIRSFYLSIIYMYVYQSEKEFSKQNYGYNRVLNRLLLTKITSHPGIIKKLNKEKLKSTINNLKIDIKTNDVIRFYFLDFLDYEKPILNELFKYQEFNNGFGRRLSSMKKKKKKSLQITLTEKYSSRGFFNIYLPHDKNNYAIQMASKIGDYKFLNFLIDLRDRNPYIDATCDHTNIPLINVFRGLQTITNETSSDIDYMKCLQILQEQTSIPADYEELFALYKPLAIISPRIRELQE